MHNSLSHTTHLSVYPGEYVPLFKENDFKQKTKHFSRRNGNILPVNIEEAANYYKIEIAVPGVKREKFLIKAFGNVLTISVIHDRCDFTEQDNFQAHEFKYCFNRRIVLADNADTAFANANYKSGILQMYIPKSSHPLKTANTKIAIY
jgi:HSP20 family protein